MTTTLVSPISGRQYRYIASQEGISISDQGLRACKDFTVCVCVLSSNEIVHQCAIFSVITLAAKF